MNPIFMYTVWSTIAVAAVVSTIIILRLLIGLGPLLARLETIAQWLEAGRPRYAQILDDLAAQLGELRGISASAHRIVSKAEGVAGGLQVAAQPIIDEVHDISQAVRRVHATVAAVRTGLVTLFFHRRAAARGPQIVREHEPES